MEPVNFSDKKKIKELEARILESEEVIEALDQLIFKLKVKNDVLTQTNIFLIKEKEAFRLYNEILSDPLSGIR